MRLISKIANQWRDASFLRKSMPPDAARKYLEMGRQPIVIGGCGRSGTTLLLSVLSCHPHIFGIDVETRALCPGAYQDDTEGKRNADGSVVPFTYPIMRRIYEYLFQNEDRIAASATRWCEKTPKNILCLAGILDYFGKDVRFINIVRDGRDVISSRHPSNPGEFWVSPERWIAEVTAGLKYEGNPQVLTIRYEDLILDYEKTVREICLFIGEEFSDAFLSYPNSTSVKKSMAWSEPAIGIHAKSIGRWNEECFKDRVAALLANQKAVNLLKHYHYLD